MTTQQTYSRKLLTLMFAGALLFVGPGGVATVYAQDSRASCGETLSRMDESLQEMETIAEEFADQRDQAMRLAEKNRTERDVCEGRLAEVSAIVAGLQVTQRDYERTIAQLEARPRPAVWYWAGFVTPIALAGIGLLVWVAIP